ncbi:hypothetical protein T492DRAFT_72730 [Pavlovales sp. CCMP2436]|nr:hypothetical protein T492DRAFT_72730 [Pavlovales sp. CCMP2436]
MLPVASFFAARDGCRARLQLGGDGLTFQQNGQAPPHFQQYFAMPLPSPSGQPPHFQSPRMLQPSPSGQPPYFQSPHMLQPSPLGQSPQLATTPARLNTLSTPTRCLTSKSRSYGYRPQAGAHISMLSKLALEGRHIPDARLAWLNSLNPAAQQAAMCAGAFDSPEGLLDHAAVANVLDAMLDSQQVAPNVRAALARVAACESQNKILGKEAARARGSAARAENLLLHELAALRRGHAADLAAARSREQSSAGLAEGFAASAQAAAARADAM